MDYWKPKTIKKWGFLIIRYNTCKDEKRKNHIHVHVYQSQRYTILCKINPYYCLHIHLYLNRINDTLEWKCEKIANLSTFCLSLHFSNVEPNNSKVVKKRCICLYSCLLLLLNSYNLKLIMLQPGVYKYTILLQLSVREISTATV